MNRSRMATLATLAMFAISASIIMTTGCGGDRSSQYPDRSVSTIRRVDDINRNARDQKAAVEAEYARVSTRLDFNERQIRDKHTAKRQALANEANTETTDREAKIRAIEIQAKHDKAVIDAHVADTLKASPPDKVAETRADAASRKSEIDSQATGKLAVIVNETARSNAAYIQRGLEIDREEAKEISALEQERSKARNVKREQELKIDQWLNTEMAKVEKDSDPANK